MTRVDGDGIFTYYRGAGLQAWALEDDQLVGCNIFEAYAHIADTLREVLAGGEAAFVHEGTSEGKTVYFQNYFFPDSVAGAGLVTVSLDITSLRDASHVPRQSVEERFRSLVETIPHGIEDIDAKGHLVFGNSAYHGMLEYPDGALIGRNILELVATAAERASLQDHLGFLRDEQPAPTPLFGQRRTRSGRVIEVRVDWNYRRDPEGRVVGFSSIITDITEHREAHEKIKASLRAKEVLLSELHHRVKNNLQVIASLLNMQSRQVEDAQVAELFRESRNRVRSMALTHEQLYQAEDLARIDFARYLRALGASLFRSYGADPRAVKLEVDTGEIAIPLDLAIPCGLIVTELISNCLKHAFPGGRGEIRVGLCTDDEGQLTLAVGDNGVGLPAGLDPQASETLGLRLVTSLADQIGGEIALDRSAGTQVRIRFQNPDGEGGQP